MLRLFLAMLALALPLRLAAQPTGGAKTTEDDLFKTTPLPTRTSDFGKALPPVERPINPATYRLGPNDQLLLSLPIVEPGEFPLTIAMDNTLQLPRGFALLDVEGMTLERLRRTVDSLFRSRSSTYRNLSLSLVKPRMVYVTVSGDVLIPGRYVLSAADRVTTAIYAANTISETLPATERAALSKEQKAMNDTRPGSRDLGGVSSSQLAQRWVTLRHNDGTSQEVDLLRYRALGRESDNPTLREGDEVYVRTSDPTASQIAVVGSVNSPTATAFRPGDNALMLVRLSGGYRSNADPTGAYISRASASGLQRIAVNLDDTAALASIQLEAGDQLVIPNAGDATTGPSRSGVVSVIGEVARPSTYPIIPGVTKLSEVINTAGGVTPDASLNGAYIFRASDPKLYRAVASTPYLGQLRSTSALPLDDTARYVFDMENQQDRVSADFTEIIGRRNLTKDVALQSGDQIVIPPTPKNVYVRGRVHTPGWVAYTPGTSYEFYLDAAGGLTAAAEKGRIEVLKYGTGIWEDPGSTTIMPGDEIYVPGERDVPPRTSLEVANTVIGIAGAVLSIAVNVFSFVRELNRK
jgi:protein involved in polysaccharide export with SLBB domain